MIRSISLIAVLAALSGLPALAQEATTDTTATEAPAAEGTTDGTTADATATPDGLDLGEEVTAPGTVGSAYEKEGAGDWTFDCIVTAEEEPDFCQMFQPLMDETDTRVAEVRIVRLKNAGRAVAGGNFIVPLETLLTEKLLVSVDGGAPRSYDYSFCNPVGCIARVGFTAEDISRFKAGAAAKVTLVPAMAPDQKVTLNMSLTGFTAAYDQSSQINP